MEKDAAEGTIKFVSDFSSVIMTNRVRWQATMHEVETQKVYSWAKKQRFFEILLKITIDYAYFYLVFFHNSYIYSIKPQTQQNFDLLNFWP